MAKLAFYYSTMGAGKSTEAIKTYDIYKRKHLDPIVIKPIIDNREGNFCGWGTAKSRITKEEIPAYYIKNVKEELRTLEYGSIIVDEAQFLTRDDIIALAAIVDTQDVNVLAYGLKTDINGHLFSGSAALLEFADEIKEIEMLCDEPNCMNKATHHLRYVNNIPDSSNETVAIEKDNVTYKSVCRWHWAKMKNIYSRR